MNNVKVLTVATHSYGFFEKMVNNDYGITVEVLAYGKKWTGFRMKLQEVYNRIKDLPDDNIVIFLDGFDTIIRGKLNVAVERFKKMKCPILFSNEVNFSTKLRSYIGTRVFGTCHDNKTANSGLYMGYVKYLKQLLIYALQSSCKDDQCVINSLCRYVDYIKIDVNNEIFHNIKYGTEKEAFAKSNAIFFQIPGLPSVKRNIRGIQDLSQFFIIEITLLFISLIFIFFYLKLKVIGYITLLVMIMYFRWIDTSCVYTLVPGYIIQS